MARFERAYSSNIEDFRNVLSKSKHMVVLTGAGISAESGIPTFRGEGGLWKTYKAQDLATPTAFKRSPSLVWEFYQYRREIVLNRVPNKGHYALVECEKKFKDNGNKFTLITQNIDGLHAAAGSQNIIEMHGNLFKTRCTKCLNVDLNREPTIYKKSESSEDNYDDLPKCKLCNGLLRPHVVWFNEALDQNILEKIHEELFACDTFLIIGTSGTVYPAANFANLVRSAVIAEFNIEKSPAFNTANYYFCGPSGETLPKCLL